MPLTLSLGGLAADLAAGFVRKKIASPACLLIEVCQFVDVGEDQDWQSECPLMALSGHQCPC